MHQVDPAALRDPSSVLTCLCDDLKLEDSIYFPHAFEDGGSRRGWEARGEGLRLVSISQILLVESGTEGDFGG
jgi:hypothetical protein